MVTTRLLGSVSANPGQLPFLSPDGKHVAQVLAVRREDATTWQVILDGQAQRGSTQPTLLPQYPFSADGRHFAYLTQSAAGARVMVDGVAGPSFPSVIPQTIRLSADGRHVAYLAGTPDGWRAVHDGQPEAAYPWLRSFLQFFGPWEQRLALGSGNDGSFWSLDPLDLMSDPNECLLFSPDGTRLAYAASPTDDSALVIIDGREGPSFTAVTLLRFTPDGRHFSYWARDGQRWVVMRDGAEVGRYDGLYSPTLSPDGTHLAYVARNEGKWWMVVEGTTENYFPLLDGPSSAGDPHIPLLFSPDGKHVACTTGGRVVVDGVASRAYESIHGLAYSPDGQLACMVNNHALLFDGKVGPAFDKVTDPVCSPDGHHIAYAAKKSGRWRVVRDGVPGKRYDHILAMPRRSNYACCLSFSPDSLRLAYVAQQDDNCRLVVDSVEGPLFPVIDGDSLIFSPDSWHIGYTAITDKGKQVVIDGMAGKPYAEVGPVTFSADCRHWGYLARTDATHWRAVIDGVESPPYLFIPGWNDNGTHIDTPYTLPDHWLTFDAPDRYHYYACDASGLLRVEGSWTDK